MPNPGGINQLGSDRVPYGDAKRLKTLADEAPMSGAPLATRAVQAPRRARRNPQRQAAPAPALVPVVPELAQPPQIPTQDLYAQIASIEGASPLVQSIFGSQVPAS